MPERLGDLDEDGVPTVFDLTRLISHINGDPALPASQALYGDMDEDGDVDQIDVQLLRDAVLLRFELAEPAFNYLLDATPANVTDQLFALSGTSIPGATVMVEGAASPLTVMVGEDGTFSLQVNLKANQLNRLYITVFDDVGNASPPRALHVTHDTAAPNLFIDFPSNNSEVFTAAADIAGRVGDILSGYRGLDVKVQGETAEVIVGIGQNGTFERSAVPLEIGKNVITVSATDALGNTVTKTSNVFRRVPVGPVIQVAAGNNQEGLVDDILLQPATVKVSYPDGTPIANKLVSFKVIKSNGMLAKSSDMADFIGANLEYQALTDAQGIAKAHWRLGHDAGCGNNRLQATSKDISGVAYFCASANAAPPTQINIGSGNNQRASTNSVAVEPLRVWVNDSCNGSEGVEVLFRVVSGGGKVNGSDSALVKTSRTGHAGVAFKLGPNQGNNIVMADFVGNESPPATFVTYGMAAQQSGDTTWEGIVFDNDNNPIGGAACYLEIGGVAQPTVYTDEDGVFRMINLPSGPGYLHVDGLSATSLGGEELPAGSFPELHYEVLVVENAANSLGEPVLLPPLDPINAQLFDNSSDLVLTCEGIEGLKMTISAGSMRLPDGTKPDWRNPVLVSLNQVHHDDAPMPMPDGVSPPFAWTLQPAGSTFDPPVTIEYPNMKGLAPGAVAYFLSYDHDLEEFVIAASGHVTDDGATILTDPGAGLSKAGWGCNCPPYSVTTDCENCEYECEEKGTLTGGSVAVNKEKACEGDTLTFTASGVTHQGGKLKEKCPDKPDKIINVTAIPTYEWTITSAALASPLTGTGASASVQNTKKGTYTCVFKAKVALPPSATVDCIPGPITLPSKSAEVIKLDTQTFATTPADRTRKKIGVAEEVNITVSPAATANWSVTGGGTVTPASGPTTKFKADKVAGTPKIKATLADGTVCEIAFTVVEPSSETAVIQSEAVFPAGQQGVQMELCITVQPSDVSFYNVEMFEVAGGPANKTGYFTAYTDADLHHNPNPNWIQLNQSNQWLDTAGFFGWPSPWTIGGWDWIIPTKWRVVGDAGAGKAVPNRLQKHRITHVNGTSTESKLGRTATRTP